MIDYDNTATYRKGNYCMYEGVLYVANQDIDTAEEFDSSHWDETSVINELEGVNKSNNYSTTEQRIGTWIDGKPLYRKIITVPQLANNGTVNAIYEDTFKVQTFDVYVENPTAHFKFKLPIVSSTISGGIGVYNQDNWHQIAVQTYSDRTAFTNNYAIIEYTKTTD